MQSLSFYQKLDKIPFHRTLALKVACVAFLGIHVPLILSVFVLLGFKAELSTLRIILYLLLFTLVATAITLFFLNKLVQPIHFLSSKLRLYVTGNEWQLTPAAWRDEVGLLSRDMDICIKTLEKTLHEKNDLYRLLSHDLKGMLATLQASLMILQMEFEEGNKESDFLRDKIELVERQILNVNSLLYYYRDPMTSNYNEGVSSVELMQITGELVELYRSALILEDKTVLIDIPSDAKVKTGKFLLRHLIFNLLDNAVKYSDKGSIITVTFKDGKFKVENDKNKQTVFAMNDWKKSTGLGHKIISKTAKDLGFPLIMDYCEERYSVSLQLVSPDELKFAS